MLSLTLEALAISRAGGLGQSAAHASAVVQIRLEHASLTFFRNNDLIASFTAMGERAKGSAVLLAGLREFGLSWTSCCWFPARSQLQT